MSGIGWSFSLRTASWGVWIDRPGWPFVWRFNFGPLHVVRITGQAQK